MTSPSSPPRSVRAKRPPTSRRSRCSCPWSATCSARGRRARRHRVLVPRAATTWSASRSASSPRSTRPAPSRRSSRATSRPTAFALYEAWVKIQTGECDTALVFANGKSSAGPIADILTFQLDPYVEAPLRPSMHVLAGLQARAGLDAGALDERAMAEVAARSHVTRSPTRWRSSGANTPSTNCSPPRRRTRRCAIIDCPPVTDGANAVILAAGDIARSWCERPAWIRGSTIASTPSASASLAESRRRPRPGGGRSRGRQGRRRRAVHAPTATRSWCCGRRWGSTGTR